MKIILLLKKELFYGFRTEFACPESRALTQSTMRILLALSFCWSCLAAIATELKKQKPLRDRKRLSEVSRIKYHQLLETKQENYVVVVVVHKQIFSRN